MPASSQNEIAIGDVSQPTTQLATHFIERRTDVDGSPSYFLAPVHQVEVARALKVAQ